MTPKTYGLIELSERGLIKSVHGKPIKSITTIRQLLGRYGITKTGITPYGQPCYAVTREQIKVINNRFF